MAGGGVLPPRGEAVLHLQAPPGCLQVRSGLECLAGVHKVFRKSSLCCSLSTIQMEN